LDHRAPNSKYFLILQKLAFPVELRYKKKKTLIIFLVNFSKKNWKFREKMADDEIDYESLGGSQPLMVNAAAGATAGYFEHIAVYPIDVIKTRMQSLRQGCAPATQNPFTAMQTLIKSEGAKPLARGSGAIAFGCGPAHAIQFLCYVLGS
jgi:hypothetical protein